MSELTIDAEPITRHSVTRWHENRQFVEETQALSSVEIGEDAKGRVYPRAVKAYHASASEAGRLAVDAYHETKRRLQAAETRLQSEIEDSLNQEEAPWTHATP